MGRSDQVEEISDKLIERLVTRKAESVHHLPHSGVEDVLERPSHGHFQQIGSEVVLVFRNEFSHSSNVSHVHSERVQVAGNVDSLGLLFKVFHSLFWDTVRAVKFVIEIKLKFLSEVKCCSGNGVSVELVSGSVDVVKVFLFRWILSVPSRESI